MQKRQPTQASASELATAADRAYAIRLMRRARGLSRPSSFSSLSLAVDKGDSHVSIPETVRWSSRRASPCERSSSPPRTDAQPENKSLQEDGVPARRPSEAGKRALRAGAAAGDGSAVIPARETRERAGGFVEENRGSRFKAALRGTIAEKKKKVGGVLDYVQVAHSDARWSGPIFCTIYDVLLL